MMERPLTSSIDDERIITLSTLGVDSLKTGTYRRESDGRIHCFLDMTTFGFQKKSNDNSRVPSALPQIFAMSFTNYEHLTDYKWLSTVLVTGRSFKMKQLFINIEPLNSLSKITLLVPQPSWWKLMCSHKPATLMRNIKYGEDWELWLRMSENHQIGVLNSVQVGYLMRAWVPLLKWKALSW